MNAPMPRSTKPSSAICHALSGLRLIFQPISKPAVNKLPLVASPTEIEKVRPFFL